jgi:hypothetical protein
MASVGFRTSLSRSCSIFSCSNLSFAYIDPVVVLRGLAIDILLLVLA